MIRRLSPALAALALLLGAVAAYSSVHYSDGPTASHTGAPAIAARIAETDCTSCHMTDDGNGGWLPNLNLPGGQVRVLDLPQYYVPGRTYTLRVELACDSSANASVIIPRWGFQLTAVDIATGGGAGDFAVTDSTIVHVKHALVGPWAGRTYVEHAIGGLHEGSLGPVEWSFDWIAPADPVGSVAFYVAGNAANGSEEPSGDYIFTASASILDTTTAVRNVSWGALKARRR
jgi:hypothetical protein